MKKMSTLQVECASCARLRQEINDSDNFNKKQKERIADLEKMLAEAKENA